MIAEVDDSNVGGIVGKRRPPAETEGLGGGGPSIDARAIDRLAGTHPFEPEIVVRRVEKLGIR
jgi:hypothetical protein